MSHRIKENGQRSPDQGPLFTEEHTGCHADGALGHDHVRSRLRELLDHVIQEREHRASTRERIADTILSLGGPMPDDAYDEYDAMEILARFTQEGLFWEMMGGVLYLSEEPPE